MNPYTPSLLVEPELDASGILARALARCQARGLGKRDQLLTALRAGDPVAHSYFRYAVAEELCHRLARLGTAFRAVYIYGSTIDDRACLNSDVDIIVWVYQKTVAIEKWLALANLNLTKAYRKLVDSTQVERLLDVHLVDDEDVERGRGYGGVIRSLWTAPICMWRRKAGESSNTTHNLRERESTNGTYGSIDLGHPLS